MNKFTRCGDTERQPRHFCSPSRVQPATGSYACLQIAAEGVRGPLTLGRAHLRGSVPDGLTWPSLSVSSAAVQLTRDVVMPPAGTARRESDGIGSGCGQY